MLRLIKNSNELHAGQDPDVCDQVRPVDGAMGRIELITQSGKSAYVHVRARSGYVIGYWPDKVRNQLKVALLLQKMDAEDHVSTDAFIAVSPENFRNVKTAVYIRELIADLLRHDHFIAVHNHRHCIDCLLSSGKYLLEEEGGDAAWARKSARLDREADKLWAYAVRLASQMKREKMKREGKRRCPKKT